MTQKTIPVNKIRIGDENLRLVREDDARFIEIRDSVKARGVLLPILVSEKKDVDGEIYYLLVDGGHRYTACLHLGIENIPAQITQTADGEAGKIQILELQIEANAQRAETRPAEYAAALKTLMASDMLMTKAELAAKVNKSTQWIDKMLSLNRVTNERIRSLIDSGEIPVTNAYTLAKLAEEDQANFIDSAMVMGGAEFNTEVSEFLQRQKEATRKGQEKVERAFVAKASRRKDSEIQSVIDDSTLIKGIVDDSGITSPYEAFKMGLQYSLSLDPSTIETRKQEWEDAERIKEEKAEKAKNLRAAARAQETLMQKEAAAQAAAEVLGSLSPEELQAAKIKAAENLAAKAKAKAAKAEAEETEAEDSSDN